MTARADQPVLTLGFLTVVEHNSHGLFGGLLVLNLAGRPLEFHCTAPVKANRAQEILYGPTLKPYLYGEQIGGSLAAKLKSQATAILTDSPEVLSLRDHSSIPVLLVEAVAGESSETELRLDPPHPEMASHHRIPFRLGSHAVQIPRSHADDQQLLERAWQDHEINLDLQEPFSRIREAIEEAQTAGK